MGDGVGEVTAFFFFGVPIKHKLSKAYLNMSPISNSVTNLPHGTCKNKNKNDTLFKNGSKMSTLNPPN